MIKSEVEAQVVAIACIKTPAGREQWTMQLIANRVVELIHINLRSAIIRALVLEIAIKKFLFTVLALYY
jgi:hypothetical protein